MTRAKRLRWLLVAVTVVVVASSLRTLMDANASLGWRILNVGFIVGMLANTVWMWRRPPDLQ
jgi:hypothetical protein